MELAGLQEISLAMGQERSTERVLQVIVDGLTSSLGFALTRIWVKKIGDRCDTCRFATACPQRVECLHLAASNGHSLADPGGPWKNLNGRFSRFPLGHRKIGRIGASGESLLMEDLHADSPWVMDGDWVREEGIRSFAGHPLVFRGEVLGVIGIFCRRGVSQEAFRWLRYFADQAAIAIANARAFEEISRLKRELEEENDFLRAEVLASDKTGEMLGNSPAMRNLLEQIELVAPTEAAVLIQGESGSGKELVARALHRRSRRAERPLIKVNCAAIPRELFESEFFGHVKGAFTGAVRDRVGRFQLADRGTLLLDEVGEIPLDLQSKLLRVLQEGEFERIGEATTRRVNVRVIAATNRDLRREVDARRFREDLLYRLSVFPVTVPPLRERPDDIPLLAAHFLETSAARLGISLPRVRQEDVARLRNYSWPGNVRELSHVVERAAILSRGGQADFSFLGGSGGARPALREETAAGETRQAAVRMDSTLRASQIENIRRALEHAKGRVYGPGGAAELLGIPPTTLTSRIRRWKIQ